MNMSLKPIPLTLDTEEVRSVLRIALDDDAQQALAFVKTVLAQKVEKALKQAGAGMNDVVRTRMYVTDISKWEEVAKAHAEFFRDIKPAATMVEVKALIDPELLVEIEVTAVVTA